MPDQSHNMDTLFWINLQSLYDLRIAQQQAGKTIKALPTLKRMTAVHA